LFYVFVAFFLKKTDQLVGLFSYIGVPEGPLREKMPNLGFTTKPRLGTGGNWTWDTKKHGRYVVLSNDNLTATTTTGSGWNYSLVIGTKEFKNSDAYWEVKIDYCNDDMIGVVAPNIAYDSASVYSNHTSKCWFIRQTSNSLYGGTVGIKGSATLSARTGDTIGFALKYNKLSNTFDMQVYKNRNLVGTPFRCLPYPVVAAQEFCYTPSKITLDPKARKPK